MPFPTFTTLKDDTQKRTLWYPDIEHGYKDARGSRRLSRPVSKIDGQYLEIH